jgi:hypothetical protein
MGQRSFANADAPDDRWGMADQLFPRVRVQRATMTRAALLLPITLLTGLVPATAQEKVRITDLSVLFQGPSTDTLPLVGLQACGATREQMAAVVRGSDRTLWPEGLRTDSARVANNALAANYTAEKVCRYTDGEHTIAIVRVPAPDNYHMPEEMRSPADIYLCLPESAVETVVIAQAARPRPSKGPSYRHMAKARITQPDRLYATYDLASDEKALKVLANKGMSQAEIDAVVFRSTEHNWPEGLDNFAERYPQLAQLKKMKAFHAAKWDGKVLLVIPAELNRKLPPRLRPYLDIYMVFEEEAVVVSKTK